MILDGPPSHRPSSNMQIIPPDTVTMQDTTSEAPDPEKMNKRRKEVLQMTWGMIETGPGSDMVVSFYDRLLKLEPQTKSMFSEISLRQQALKVFEVLQVAVRFLNDMEQITPLLQDIGIRHHRDYGVENAHYSVMTMAFLEAMDHCFSPAASNPLTLPPGISRNDVMDAWKWVLDLIGSVMSDAAAKAGV